MLGRTKGKEKCEQNSIVGVSRTRVRENSRLLPISRLSFPTVIVDIKREELR